MSVTLLELKNHLRIDGSTEDAELQIYLDAAIEYIEDETGQKLTREARTAYFDDFGDMELIGKSPESITVTYVDTDSVSQTLSSSIYTLKTHKARAYLTLAYGQSYPSVQDIDAAVSVAYTSGFDASTIPAKLKQAVLVMAANLYEVRESVAIGVSITNAPLTVENLIRSHKVTTL